MGRDGQGSQAAHSEPACPTAPTARYCAGQVGPKTARIRGYVCRAFKEAFERYLAPKGDVQPHTCTPCDEMGTSDDSEVHTAETGCAVAESQKPNNDALVGGWAVAKGGTGGNGQAPLEREPDPPGLSTYRIRQLADEYTEQAYANAQE